MLLLIVVHVHVVLLSVYRWFWYFFKTFYFDINGEAFHSCNVVVTMHCHVKCTGVIWMHILIFINILICDITNGLFIFVWCFYAGAYLLIIFKFWFHIILHIYVWSYIIWLCNMYSFKNMYIHTLYKIFHYYCATFVYLCMETCLLVMPWVS